MNTLRWRDWPHVLEMQQFSPEMLEQIIGHAHRFEEALEEDRLLPRLSRPKRRCIDGEKQRRMRTLFYEGSTRTELTFLDAAAELECSTHAVKDPQAFSSAVKGESLQSATAAFTRTGGMRHLRGADGVVVRHGMDGASARVAAVVDTALGDGHAKLPFFVINAGDGMGQHPTQALVDLTTIYEERTNNHHPLDKLAVLFPGDLRRSRVVNSLLYSFGRFENEHQIKVIFCCPKGFGPKVELLEYLTRHRVGYEFVAELDFPKAIKQASIVYMTRIQRERKLEEGIKPINREAYVFRKEYLGLLQPGALIMHPLPINEDPEDPPPEIDPELGPMAYAGDPRCAWLRQSHRGFPVRAALLDLIFAGMDEEWEKIHPA